MNLQINPQPHFMDAHGYTNLIDADSGTRYLRTPYGHYGYNGRPDHGWQYWSDIDGTFVNFFDADLIDQLDAAYTLLLDLN